MARSVPSRTLALVIVVFALAAAALLAVVARGDEGRVEPGRGGAALSSAESGWMDAGGLDSQSPRRADAPARDRAHVAPIGVPAARLVRQLLAAPQRSPLLLPLGQRASRLGEDGAAMVATSRGPIGIVESSDPLWTRDGRRIDLSLERDANGAISPMAARVPVSVDPTVVGSARLPEDGIGIALAGSSAGRGEVSEAAVRWVDALPDTDVFVRASGRGFETFAQLGSPSSPSRLRWHVSLADGESLRPVDGGVTVVRGTTAVARIEAPWSIDGNGRPVATRMTLEGGDLVVAVEHRQPAVTYPVLVDPAVYSLSDVSIAPSSEGWIFGSGNSTKFHGSYGSGSLGTGLYVTSDAPWAYLDGAAGIWSYQAPRQSYVYRIDFSGVTHQGTSLLGQMPSCVQEGLRSGGAFSTTTTWSQGTTSGSGAWSSCVNFSSDSRTTCVSADCSPTGPVGNEAAVRLYMSGAGLRTNPATLFVGGATVYLSDDNDPYLVGDAAPTRWFSSGLATWSLDVNDGGLGVSSVSYAIAGGGSGSLSRGCTGTAASRCPAHWTPDMSVDTAALDEGENAVTLTAHDALGRASTPVHTTVRVDRTAPVAGYSGTLLDVAGRTVSTPVGVQVDATDEAQAGSRAGVRSIAFFLDGVQKDIGEQQCPAGSCALSRSWSFDPAQVAAGEHTVRVLVTDWAGNTTERTFTLSTGAGRITSIDDGFRTTRRVPLEAKAYNGATGVRFQYRKKADDAWSDVPLGTVRNADGSAVTAWPVALDDGRSPALVWDLVGDSLTAGMISSGVLHNDGPIEMRGLFEGGDGGSTQELWVTLDRLGTSARGATAPIGPGQVDLVTGNFSLAQTDVSVAAYKSPLTVSRTYNSRAGGGYAALGPGWEMNVPSASVPYTSLYNLAAVPTPPPPPPPDQECLDYPDWCEFEAEDEEVDGPQPLVVVSGPDGEEITFAEEGAGYKPDPGYETLKLERVMSPSQPGQIDAFKLTDTDSGEVVVFKGSGVNYRADEVRMTGTGGATYVYSAQSFPDWLASTELVSRTVLTRMIAPRAAGIDCDAALVRGCRALNFVYGSSGNTSGRVTAITLTAWDDNTATMKTTTVVTYTYDSNGRLYLVDDPRIGTTHEWQFNYDSARRLEQITPAFKASWWLTYDPAATDPSVKDPRGLTKSTGRLRSVRRLRDLGSSEYAYWTVAYSVPISGAGAPYQLGAADVAAWGQARPPVDATAIFRPDDVPTNPPGSYQKATVFYLDAHGRIVDTALPGGRISTSESDRSGNTVYELTGGNRERALATGSTAAEHAAAAAKLATTRTYDGGGVRLLEEYGPEHDITLAEGADVRARRHSVYAYDEGAPAAGGPFNLPTTITVGARVAGEQSDRDVRTTKTQYDWTLRQPTEQIVDPSGLNMRTVTVFDSQTGLPVESRMPRNPDGGDASATRTIYWTAGANGEDSACADRPEWAGSVCKVKPVAQPNTPGLPDLPVSKTEYGYHLQPTLITETSGSLTRTTTITYDAGGRIASREMSGGDGVAPGRMTYDYDNDGCAQLLRQRLYDGNDTYDTVEWHDWLCRPQRYETAQVVNGVSQSINTATLSFDLVGRISQRQVQTSGTTQTFGYDSISGELTTVDDPQLGRISASYDADGRVTAEVFETPTVTATTAYDEAGTAIQRTYTKGGSCSQNCTWLDDSATSSIHGQWLAHTGTLSGQAFSYDAAGRLTRVQDTPAGGGCTTRTYAFDADSNRTSLTVHDPAGDGSCTTSGQGTVTTHSYDSADRIIGSGYTYDAFGRIIDVPGADAGGPPLESTYYADDRARQVLQGGLGTTTVLDALRRPRVRTETNAQPETLYYGDLSDEPLYSVQGSTTTRFISAISGDLAAISRQTGSTSDVRLQLTNLHGDIVGEAPATAATMTPSATWETDEFGVPRTPVRPTPITQIGDATSAISITTTLTLTKPDGVLAGDLLLIGVGNSPAAALTPPAGWTLTPAGGSSTSASTYSVYRHIATNSEPSSYVFTGSAGSIKRGGLVALRNTDATTPILSATSATGAGGTTPTANAITPSVDGAAILTFVGSDSGDADGGGAWSFPSSHTELWDRASGPTSSDRNHAAALRVLINGKNVNQGTTTLTDQTGLTAAAWVTITVGIAPKPPGTEQYRYHYLGAKERPMDLQSGIIGMGARIYNPYLGRFLQNDPIPGGSCNAYDYACGDPVNRLDLAGTSETTADDDCVCTDQAVLAALAAVSIAVSAVVKKCLDHGGCNGARGFHKHHIVARRAPRAAPGRRVLRRFAIGVNSAWNLVVLTAGFHARLHTTAYYEAVNDAVGAASAYGGRAVKMTLRAIAALLERGSADAISSLAA